MSEPKHTSGPWRAVFGPDWQPRAGEVDDFVCVEHFRFDAIEIYAPRHAESAEEHFANAHLIAAAPDLLAALKSCVDECERQCIGNVGLIRAAIAKAEGQ